MIVNEFQYAETLSKVVFASVICSAVINAFRSQPDDLFELTRYEAGRSQKDTTLPRFGYVRLLKATVAVKSQC